MDRSVVTLVVAVLLLEAGSGSQGVLLPLRANLAHFSMPLVGWPGTSYYLGFFGG